MSRTTLHPLTIILLILACAFSPSSSLAQQGGTTLYVYDDNGRLQAVIVPSGETVIYDYDRAGNVQAVRRQSSTQFSFVSFTPSSGTIATAVTIYGTGFSTTASENRVSFNGVAATVSAATANEIITSVPPGAATGPITITTPRGSATSSIPFTVAITPPTITRVAPLIGVVNDEVNITGTNFVTPPSGNRVTFNVTDAAVSAVEDFSRITTRVPSAATSGKVSVATSSGSATSSEDFFIPPAPHTVADVNFTGRMAIGETRTVLGNTNGKINLILFDGVQGQRIYLSSTTPSTAGTANISIINPNNSILGGPIYLGPVGCCSFINSAFIDTRILPLNGTYTILMRPSSSHLLEVNLALQDVPPDITGAISVGGPAVPVNITAVGQNARLTFTATAGQHLNLNLSGSTIASSSVSIVKPDGTPLIPPTSVGTGVGNIDVPFVPATGTYTILLDPQGAYTGSMTLALSAIQDVMGTITAGGPAVTFTTTASGQNARLTFSGTAGQTLNLNMRNVTITRSRVSVYRPDGTILSGPVSINTSGGDLPIENLPVSGVYTILVDPEAAFTGSMTLALSEVFEITGAIVVGGAALTVTTTTPGQNARLTFSGVAGERIFLNMTNVTIPESHVSVYNPDGTTLVERVFVNTRGGAIDIRALPATGTYTILIDPVDTYTGRMTLQAATVGAIALNGPPVTIVITAPDQNAQLTFSGVAGQVINLLTSAVTIPNGAISIFKPDGTLLASGPLSGLSGLTLQTTGTYTILVDPTGTSTGRITLRLTGGGEIID